MFSDEEINKAAEICNFFMELLDKYPERWDKVIQNGGRFPSGDIAYGSALVHWEKNGRPARAAFSYAKGQKECPFLMEFKNELSEKFGMPILPTAEGGERIRIVNEVHKVFDWGDN